jgi:hypothetical protein
MLTADADGSHSIGICHFCLRRKDMAKKKDITLTTVQQVFASATNVTDGSQLIYASAFADAARQLSASLAPASNLVNEIRARATELTQLADLIETTLTAEFPESMKKKMDEKKDEPEKDDDPDEEKKESKPDEKK